MFKDKQYHLLFESKLGEFIAEEQSSFSASNRINLYNNIETNISTQRKEYEKKQMEAIKNITLLKTQLKQLDNQIESSTNVIANTNSDIIQIKKEIGSIKDTIEILRKKILQNRNILLNYLTYTYKKKNTLYINGEFDNLRSILLNTENISDILNDLHFKGTIQIAGKKLIDQHRNFVSEIYVKKLEGEKKEALLKRMRKSLIIQRGILNDKKKFKEKLLSISKGKQGLYEKYINEKLSLERKLRIKSLKQKIKFNAAKKSLLNEYGCDFVDLSLNTIEGRSLSPKCLDINKMILAESKLVGFKEKGNNIFDWPINPLLGISAYFHDPSYKQQFGSNHDAIDIIARQGTPIQAPMDGYVILLEPPVSEDYAYLAMKHANGYISVYGHLSEVLVKKYDFVKAGQVFAKTGGEYGTNGAGFMTTGPHLHMEIFKDKTSVDPLNLMSLIAIPFSMLPEKYRFKFYLDFKEARGYEYQNKDTKARTFKLEGDTEVERQKSLISKYAVGTFNNWRLWIEESLDGNIDPTFVMCIGLAETTLGRHMKTPYNIGNVGNTDSGATKTYRNARNGIYWIVRTLNNKILGHYNEVKDLSRYGNKTGPIYASSPDHWHNNIIKCMSHVKGIYVPDNYNFRIVR